MKKSDNLEVVGRSLAGIFCKLGMKDIDASILAALMMEDKGLCVYDVKERLSYSVSGITFSLHRLMESYMIARGKKGKRYLYRVDTRVFSAHINLVEKVDKHDVSKLKSRIEKAVKLERHRGKPRKLMEKVEKVEKHLKMSVSNPDIWEETGV